MTGTPAIRRAGPDDLPAVIAVLAAALDDTEIARWLVPDPAARPEVYRRYFALVTPWFFEHGTPYVTADGSAAALWVRLSGKFAPNIADYERGLTRACGPATPRFLRLDVAMDTAHPDWITHDYLAFLGVHPDRQGRGIGSRLLSEHHRVSDRDRVPAYLEATGPRNAALYARHDYGYRTPFPVGEGPSLYPMLRDYSQATPSPSRSRALR
ncbi:GNAT family N-acetyltransferase [Dactylosporangium sp. CA-092794]|uniref:GNAT family N-acetyltransferase n=1 Tax=Dactylosporangium sp. CA-092794 TaxID=3239929 RepID=UPI003D8AF444